MASYNNFYGNIVYSRLSRWLSDLIMDIAMSGTSDDQRDNIEQCNIMIQKKAATSIC